LLSWLLLRYSLLGNLLVKLLRQLLGGGLACRRLCRGRLLRLPVQRRRKVWVNLSRIHRGLLARLRLISRHRWCAHTLARKEGRGRTIGDRSRYTGWLDSTKRVLKLGTRSIPCRHLFLPLRNRTLVVAVRRRTWWAGHATVKVVVGIYLLVGIAVKLRWELIALLDIEGEAAVDCLMGISWMALLPEVALRQRGVLGERRSCGLRVIRPDITLTIVIEGTIQTTLIVGSG
jgi:hypothetical protein